MPAKSKAQQRLFGIAHALQKGEMKPGQATGAARRIARDVSSGDVEDFASTKSKGLPAKACALVREQEVKEIVREQEVKEIVRQVLEDEDMYSQEEVKEVQVGRNIVRLVDELRASIPDRDPETERRITGIRAAAHELIRMHGA